MPVVVRDFEVVPEPAAQAASAAQGPEKPVQLPPFELELERVHARNARVRAY